MVFLALRRRSLRATELWGWFVDIRRDRQAREQKRQPDWRRTLHVIKKGFDRLSSVVAASSLLVPPTSNVVGRSAVGSVYPSAIVNYGIRLDPFRW
jgi:hypothetical protein